jgi:hypothetical protein
MQSPLHDQQQNDSSDGGEVTTIDDELQASTSSQPIVIDQQEITAPLVAIDLPENNENEQQVVHD